MRKKILLGLLAAVAALYVWNASWRAAPPSDPALKLIAHRGVHQTFRKEGVENDTCTASLIDPPTHDFIENTLASMQAAFDAGADIVELDVHPSTDGKFAVMHDWTVDCRTDGKGVVREQPMALLKSLDVGYGYTADGGKTYPLRGKGRGLMPEFSEVMSAFPQGRFLVNFKSKEAREGDMLADMIAANPGSRERVWGAYGGDAPTFRAGERLDGLNAWSGRTVMGCLKSYVGWGWTGVVPKACRDTTVMVPINVAPWLWGWPNLFQQRMRDAGSEIILLGPYGSGDVGSSGIDTADDFGRIPAGFDGYVWTNRIERIGPLTRAAISG